MADEALDLLDRSVGSGWGQKEWIEHDPDWFSLRDDPRFRAILARLPSAAAGSAT